MQVMNSLSIHVSQAGESEGVNVEASRVKTWLDSLQPTQQGIHHWMWFSERIQQVLKRLMPSHR
jgi:hypothetical protein